MQSFDPYRKQSDGGGHYIVLLKRYQTFHVSYSMHNELGNSASTPRAL